MCVFILRIRRHLFKIRFRRAGSRVNQRVGSLAQLVSRVAEVGDKSGELSHSCIVSLGCEAQPVKLLSVFLKSRQAVFYYC